MVEITIDTADIRRVSNLIGAAGKNAPRAIMRAINRTGDMTYTQMVRSLTTQTGLRQKTIRKALKKSKSFYGGRGDGVMRAYTIRSAGGNIRLKFFGARETRKGVTAKPWNKRTLYKSAFIKAGRHPNRVGWKGGGHVFKRTGSGRLPIKQERSGLFIPEEMVKDASEQAFFGTVQRVLPERLVHELLRVLPG